MVLLGYSTHYAFGEDFPVIFTMNEPSPQPTTQTQSSLSTMINNALIDTTEIQLNQSDEDFKEQFITIESLDSNNKLLFEDSKQTNLLSVKKIPFLLPVPFP